MANVVRVLRVPLNFGGLVAELSGVSMPISWGWAVGGVGLRALFHTGVVLMTGKLSCVNQIFGMYIVTGVVAFGARGDFDR